MKRCLLLISILFAICIAPCAASDHISAVIEAEEDSAFVEEYYVLMNARGNEMTALCVMQTADDGSIVGTMLNDFGVTMLDFKYSKGKAKVMNVFGPMNKWYIRKVLNKDFTFILSNIGKHENAKSGKRSLTILPNGDIFVDNSKFKIQYTFSHTP